MVLGSPAVEALEAPTTYDILVFEGVLATIAVKQSGQPKKGREREPEGQGEREPKGQRDKE